MPRVHVVVLLSFLLVVAVSESHAIARLFRAFGRHGMWSAVVIVATNCNAIELYIME